MRRGREPERDGLQNLGWQFELLEAQTVARVEADLFEHGDRGRHRDITKGQYAAFPFLFCLGLVDTDFRGLYRLSVVIKILSLHKGDFLFQIQLVDKVGVCAMQVYGMTVQLGHRADFVQSADDLMALCLVLDGVDWPGDVAQINICRRIL